MAMGKRKSEQAPMWVPTTDLPVSPGHPFYARLNAILDEHVRAPADAGRQLSEPGVRRNGAASRPRSLGKFLTLERVCPSVAAASRRGASTQDNGGIKLWIENVFGRLELCASVCCCQSCSWSPPLR